MPIERALYVDGYFIEWQTPPKNFEEDIFTPLWIPAAPPQAVDTYLAYNLEYIGGSLHLLIGLDAIRFKPHLTLTQAYGDYYFIRGSYINKYFDQPGIKINTREQVRYRWVQNLVGTSQIRSLIY